MAGTILVGILLSVYLYNCRISAELKFSGRSATAFRTLRMPNGEHSFASSGLLATKADQAGNVAKPGRICQIKL